jgi:FemAB-related protein (PEP-CTERM system-associated)
VVTDALVISPIEETLIRSSPAVTIQQMDENWAEAWDKFVLAHPQGSPFHLNAWRRSIEDTFRYRSIYLMAVENGLIRGVLPLFLIQNILLGKVLLSVPFAVYGGVLAETPEAKQALASEVARLGESLGVQHVEIRNAWPEQTLGFHPVSKYVTFTQEVGPDERAILEAIPRKTRYMVRKSLKHSFETRILPGRSKAFEYLYAKNLRKLGTPSFPDQFFARLLQNFGKSADIREVMLEGQVASVVLTFYFRDQVLPYYGASDPAFHAQAPNDFMYYDLMRWAGANGYRTFDFGRSKKNVAGSYDFKSRWGMVERELPYEMLLVKRKSLPNFTPTNPAFSLPLKVWQKLPLSVTRRLGPIFLRMVP